MKSRLSNGLRKRRRNQNRKVRRRNLRVESLEDRRLLTFIPPSGDDGGHFTPGPGDDGSEDLGYVAGQLIVGFDADTTQAERAAILTSRYASVIQSFPNLDAVLVSSPMLGEVPGAAEQWGQIDGVLYAEPNYVVELLATPNDPLYPGKWDLNNTGQTFGSIDADIDAPEAWDIFTGTSDAVVAVIDSGIQYTHPDLSGNMWINPGEIPGDNIDNDGNGYIDDIFGIDPGSRDTDPMDGFGHGTHVAGIIGAVGNNAVGVVGVNWDVDLMAVKIGDDSGGLTNAAIVEGIEYATTMKLDFGINIVVSNNSYGGFFPSSLEEAAIRRHTDAGILFVAAAGNNALNVDFIPFYPAGYDIDGIISVAATDHNDQLSVFSNYGVAEVDLGAPGGSGTGDAEDILSTIPTDLYDWMPGTSMASPQVAGVVALVRGFEPSLSAMETKEIILDTVDPIAALDGFVLTGGRLNAHNALLGVSGFEVRGEVWSDENRDGVHNGGESGIAGWTVYVDSNQNGQLDIDEPLAVTDSNGDYVLETRKGPGTYRVAQVLPPKWDYVFPAGGTHTITVSSRTDVITDVDFGNRAQPGRVSGIKWHDLDGDGVHDFGEPGMAGIYIYADLNNSGTIALGEPAAITQADGRFLIEGIPPGEVVIREVVAAGWTISYPVAGFHVVTVEPDETTPLIDFGNATAIPDFGDAPAPYPTLLADGGASHERLAGFFLGELIDGEDDGIPDANALGDDLDNLDDEDGIEITSTLFAGTTVTAQVTVTTTIHSAGLLQGWIDFNMDGDWLDAGEQVVKDLILPTGVHAVPIAIPADVVAGNTYARWRYGYERGIGPGGAAGAGEVEDYEVLVLLDQPVAVDDAFTIEQDSSDNPLDVLANDFMSSTGVLWITDDIVMISDPERATVTVAADHASVLITPAAGVFSPPDIVFTYTVSDEVGGGGKTDTATVTILVESTMNVPFAIDDTAYVAPDATDHPIYVMDNDLPGALGTMDLESVGTAAHGTVFIDSNGTPGDRTDDFVRYTPDATFATTDQFQYVIGNANGSGPESIGTVTIFNEDVTDQDVQFDMGIVDMAGDPLFEIVVGEEFQLVVTIQDARTVTPNDVWGVFSAYLDVLYDRDLVSTIRDSGNSLGFDITFSNLYTNARKSDASLPGVLNETGAFQSVLSGGDGLGPDVLEFFRVTFTADAVGTVDFLGNPADDPVNDVLFFDPADATVPIDNVFYGLTSLDIISVEEGEGSPLDVNRDGWVSPFDALQIINGLNSDGIQDFGEGEAGGGRPNYRLDVNHDFIISPYDALLVINYLNASNLGEGEAEGEAGGFWAAPQIVEPADLGDLLPEANSLPESSSVLPGSDDLDPFAIPEPGQAKPVVADNLVATSVASAPVLAASTDWRLSIGESDELSLLDRPADLDDSSWESLLHDLAEDVLEAWLDGDQ